MLVNQSTLIAIILMVAPSGAVKVASWNVQYFGDTLAGDPNQLSALANTVRLFDLIAIQEVYDIDQSAPQDLLSLVNSLSGPAGSGGTPSTGGEYEMLLSKRSGAGRKEQHAIIYRSNILRAVNATEPPEELASKFTYHPFAVRFRVLDGAGSELEDESNSFAFISIHMKPDLVVEEIVQLEKFARWVATVWNGEGFGTGPSTGGGTNSVVQPYSRSSPTLDIMRNGSLGVHCSNGSGNVIIVGDFNADCTYVRESEWPGIAMRNRTDLYHWLIGDDADTNVATGSSCAYDRIVASQSLLPRLNQTSARVHRFDVALNLTDYAFVQRVSDHFPVAVDFIPNGGLAEGVPERNCSGDPYQLPSASPTSSPSISTTPSPSAPPSTSAIPSAATSLPSASPDLAVSPSPIVSPSSTPGAAQGGLSEDPGDGAGCGGEGSSSDQYGVGVVVGAAVGGLAVGAVGGFGLAVLLCGAVKSTAAVAAAKSGSQASGATASAAARPGVKVGSRYSSGDGLPLQSKEESMSKLVAGEAGRACGDRFAYANPMGEGGSGHGYRGGRGCRSKGCHYEPRQTRGRYQKDDRNDF